MGLFIQSITEADQPGVYALEIAPPRFIAGVSSGFIGLVAQFAWGPDEVVVTPESPQQFLDLFEPAGSPRTSTGYRATIGRKKAPWKIVRALAADAVAAGLTRAGTGGDVVVAAKYKGVLGNSITVQQADAASGLVNGKDFTITLTNAVTGSTREVVTDVPLPAGGVDVVVDVTDSKLLASFVVEGDLTAWPANATTALTGGSNSTAIGLVLGDYTGTLEANNRGVALFESEPEVRVVCHDDCGNALRAAVNTAFALHAASLGDRIPLLEGNVDAANWAAVKAYVTGSLITDRVRFYGAWVKVYDDAGTLQNSPMSTFAATVYVNTTPQLSDARWADECTDYYQAIQGITAAFSTDSRLVRKEATALGVALPIRLASGRYAVLHDRTTSQTAGKKFAIRRRIVDYLALSLVAALPEYINGPNVQERFGEIKTIVDTFLAKLVTDGILVRFSTDIRTANTPTTTAAGEFYLAIDATTPSVMEKILLLLNAGETVVVREAT
jgi:phage tail sheath protein FI